MIAPVTPDFTNASNTSSNYSVIFQTKTTAYTFYTSDLSQALVIDTLAKIGPSISKTKTENKINVTIPSLISGNSFLTIIDKPMEIPPCGSNAHPRYFTSFGSALTAFAPSDVPTTFPIILAST